MNSSRRPTESNFIKRRNWSWFGKLFDWIPFSPSRKKSDIFFLCIFSMIAKIALADGKISRSEHAVLDDFLEYELGFSAADKIRAIKIFSEARRSQNSIEYYAKILCEAFGTDSRILRNVVDLLLAVAYSDHDYDFKEEKTLRSIIKIFNVSEATFKRLQKDHFVEYSKQQKEGFFKFSEGKSSDYRNHNFHSDSSQSKDEFKNRSKSDFIDSDPYEILDAKPTDSLDSLKKRYRRLVMECHPDTLLSQGYPEKFIKLSEKKFIKINEAYKKILKMRGD